MKRNWKDQNFVKMITNSNSVPLAQHAWIQCHQLAWAVRDGEVSDTTHATRQDVESSDILKHFELCRHNYYENMWKHCENTVKTLWKLKVFTWKHSTAGLAGRLNGQLRPNIFTWGLLQARGFHVKTLRKLCENIWKYCDNIYVVCRFCWPMVWTGFLSFNACFWWCCCLV